MLIKSKKTILICSILLTSLTSCDDSEEQKKDKQSDFAPPQKPSIKNHDNLAWALTDGLYKNEDTECLEGNGIENFETFYTYFWDGSKLTKGFVKNETSVSSQPFLNSQSVSRTFKDYSTKQVCTLKNDESTPDCKGRPELVSSGQNVIICKNNTTFGRTSVETAALNGVNGLDKAWGYYHSLEGSKDNLPKLELSVFPKITQYFAKTDKHGEINYHMTDNMQFQPFPSQKLTDYQPTITIFPTGEGFFKSQIAPFHAHYWESEFIFAHEFGHFVAFEHADFNEIIRTSSFNMRKTLYEAINYATSHKWEKHNILETMHSTKSINEKRKVTFAEHWAAIGEAYADLYAFYSKSRTPGILNKFTCFEKTRDVSEAKFFNNAPKEFDTVNYGEFLSEIPTLIPTDSNPVNNTPQCESFNKLQGEHTFGAILAYGIDQLFVNSFEPNEVNHEKLGHLLLVWANGIGKLIKKEIKNFQNPNLENVTIVTMLEEAVKAVTVDNDQKTLTKKQCDIINTTMPALMENIRKNFFCVE